MEGQALRALGRVDEARVLHEEALGIVEAALPREHPLRAECLMQLGSDELASGASGRARKLLEEAVAAYDILDADPEDLADTRFALARALGHDQESARLLAKQARDVFADLVKRFPGRADSRRVATIDAWLEPPPSR